VKRREFITLLGGAAAWPLDGDRVYQRRFCPALGSARAAPVKAISRLWFSKVSHGRKRHMPDL
jgi:hypothetical protein